MKRTVVLRALLMGVLAQTAFTQTAFAQTASAQTGGFVTMLGADTVQVEQFVQNGRTINGLLVTRTPKARIVQYVIALDANGRMSEYTQTQTNGDGSVIAPDPGRATMKYLGDTVVRDMLGRDGAPVSQRISAPNGAYPISTIPIGSSFLIFELALAQARTTPIANSPTLNRLIANAAQMQPMRTRVLYSAPDSVDIDYFGQGKAGFKFAPNGQLTHSDWTNTTYRVLVNRISNIDAMAVARGWYKQDVAGTGAGPLSPRDSVITKVGTSAVSLYYSRPGKRGRVIWGDVVPWNAVWRLGADFATQFKTESELTIGAATIPAGEYTLWMLPSQTAPQLVVSKAAKVYGTQYTAAQDLVRVPMQRTGHSNSTERMTIAIADGKLSVDWDDALYSVAVKQK